MELELLVTKRDDDDDQHQGEFREELQKNPKRSLFCSNSFGLGNIPPFCTGSTSTSTDVTDTNIDRTDWQCY